MMSNDPVEIRDDGVRISEQAIRNEYLDIASDKGNGLENDLPYLDARSRCVRELASLPG